MNLTCPAVWAVSFQHDGNALKQLQSPIAVVEGIAARYTRRNTPGIVLRPADNPEDEILVVDRKMEPPANFARVIRSTTPLDANAAELNCGDGTWLKHPAQRVVTQLSDLDGLAIQALNSWANGFRYLKEDVAKGIRGLRNPQIGALHAVLAHWSVSNDVGTIVMPTGTGKTETMLSLLLAVPCHRLLVVVPTDALRTQIAGKFFSLGILKPTNVAAVTTLYPVVGVLKHRPTTPAQVDVVFGRCNVIVTTSQIAGQCSEEIRERFAIHCDFLFIDEAHHVEARTWRALKESFATKRTLQFTATPFRDDDKILEGKIIYKYPLRKAQQEDYFRPIHFKPIVEYDLAKADAAIAAAAIAELRADTTGKHVLMARADSITRANAIFEYYKDCLEYQPIELHSGIKSERLFAQNLSKLKSGQSRIVVCVDMLGEGFDLPELKIAAFHDIRKSLAVTLQIAGRFTRAREDVGDATFIANVGDVDVTDELKKLYTHDPDWNVLLPELSDKIIGEQDEVRQFNEGFTELPSDIPLRTFRPATSTVVYKTRCAEWQPQKFRDGLNPADSYERLHFSINALKKTLVIVTAQQEPVEWAELDELFTLNWELWILVWDPDQQHLYINSSGNKGVFKKLAEAVAGEGVQLIKEPEVFRCFAGINRLRLTNIGLTEQIARLISFTGRMGADVKSALSQAQKQNTRKAVLFGAGFENGNKTTVGASRRGRVWSFRRIPINAFADWCRLIGAKLADETIDSADVLRGTLTPESVETIPNSVPLYIDWPEELYKEVESSVGFFIEDNQERLPLPETSIELVDLKTDRSISFQLLCGDYTAKLTLTLIGEGETADYKFTLDDNASIKIGNRTGRQDLQDFFYDYPPIIWFADGSSLEGNLFTPLNKTYPPYDREQIQVIDWAGVDLTKEAQGIARETDSIQYKIIQRLLETQDQEIVFDDDGTGEVADVVAIKTKNEGVQQFIDVDLYHCKFAIGGKPRAQVEDLYEVCGQAQKSVSWCSQDKLIEVFSHLLRREPKRLKGREATRFQKGTKEELYRIKESSRSAVVRARIFIVQPALSKEGATTPQLALLAATENYLAETYQLKFGVIGSP
jgi:superfamily II DNA or RNA helicase